MAEADIRRNWRYTARDIRQGGDVVTGVLQAEDETAANRRLGRMGLAPITVTELKVSNDVLGAADTWLKNMGKKVKPKHLALFARQFATMSAAGLPIVRALNALAEQTQHPRLAEVLPKVRADVEAGMSLDRAMAKHRNVFPPLMTGTLEAGATAGGMDAALERIADNYEKESKLRSKVKAAMTYPVIVLIMMFVIVAGLMLFVVPTFVQIFKDLGGELPWMTQALVVLSEWSVFTIPATVVAALGFSIWWAAHRNDEKVRRFVDPLKLRIPVLGGFVQQIALARFARTFSALQESGVPPLQALELVGSTVQNTVISDAMLDVRNAVRSGQPIAETLGKHKVFPTMVVQMIATGEETGALAPMLAKVGDYYDREVESTSESLSSVLEPILLIVMGVVVGVVLIAMYLPIFSIYQYV